MVFDLSLGKGMLPDVQSELPWHSFKAFPHLSLDRRKKGSAPPSLFPHLRKLYRIVTPWPVFFPPAVKLGECISSGFLSQPCNSTDSQNGQRRGGRRDTNNSFHLLSCLYPGFRVCIMNSLLYCFS